VGGGVGQEQAEGLGEVVELAHGPATSWAAEHSPRRAVFWA
jgi:hypothetical protein